MKSVSIATKQKIKNNASIDVIDTIYLFQQYPDKMEQYDPVIPNPFGDEFSVLPGDATGFFSSGDVIIFPMKSFTTEYTVASATYDAGDDQTTITITGLTLDLNWLGQYIAKKIDIGDKLLHQGIKDVSKSVEGRELGEFDSGYLDIEVNNDEGYFQSKNKDGLFDSGYVFWTQYYVNLKGNSSDDEVLLFAGLVDLTTLEPDIYNRTLKFRTLGHSFELDRYPAFYLCDIEKGYFPRISGIEVINFVESDRTEEGIKRVKYEPFSNPNLDNIYISYVSNETPKGIKLLEFRYPNFWRWDGGNWVEFTDNPPDGVAQLTARDGTNYCYLTCGSASELSTFPDRDIEIWCNVKSSDEGNGWRTVHEFGIPYIEYDNGIKEQLKMYFPRILKYINSGSSYLEVTGGMNDYNVVLVDYFLNVGDGIVFAAPERFYGIEFILNTFAETGIPFEIKYSIGGNLFSSDFSGENDFTDGTENFTKSGKIRWADLDNWAVNDIVKSSTEAYKGYMIKITKTSGTDTIDIKQTKRVIRARGENNDFIELVLEQDTLSTTSMEDEIIIKRKSDGTHTWGMWFNNIPLQKLFETLMSNSNYEEDDYTVAEMKVSEDTQRLNIWGKPPYYSFKHSPTAFYVDYENEYVYVAVKDEIWRCPFGGVWEFICDTYSFNITQTVYIKYYIEKMYVNNNKIYFIYAHRLNTGGQTVAYTVIYDMTLGEYESITQNIRISSGLFQTRLGLIWNSGGNSYRFFGFISSKSANPAGENLCLPFRQQVFCSEPARLVACYPAPDIDSAIGGFPDFYFTQTFGNNFSRGPIWEAEMGFFAAQNNSISAVTPDPYHMTFQLGQKGIWKFWNGKFLTMQEDRDDYETTYRMVNLFNESEVFTPHIKRYYRSDIPIAHTDDGNFNHWLSFSQFRDDETDEAGSYLSKANNIKDWKFFGNFNGAGVLYNDLTTELNNSVPLATLIINVGDHIIFGHEKKIKSLYIYFYGTELATKTFTFRYWNGSSWVEKSDLLKPDNTYLRSKYYAVDMPRDWVYHATYGYAIRIDLVSNAGGYAGVIAAYPYEKVYWDSLLDSGNERMVITDMAYDTDNDVIFGCVFNRETNHAYPFQWALFMYDVGADNFEYIRSGENFTFEGTLIYKNFVYDSDRECVYFVGEDRRYKSAASGLFKAEYNSGSPKITRIGFPRERDWGAIDEMYYQDDKLFGITKGNDFVVWEYSLNYEPRIELAEFGENETLRSVLRDICIIMNYYYIIHTERFLKMLKRDQYLTDLDLMWDKNLIKSKPSISFYKHFYDSFKVDWENPFVDDSGNYKLGYTGWNQKLYSFSSKMVQNKPFAEWIALNAKEYFNYYRLYSERIKVNFMYWLEITDRFKLLIPPKIGEVDNEIGYLITSLTINSNRQITLKGLEVPDVTEQNTAQLDQGSNDPSLPVMGTDPDSAQSET